jgi:uncharacterized membrane protein YeiH
MGQRPQVLKLFRFSVFFFFALDQVHEFALKIPHTDAIRLEIFILIGHHAFLTTGHDHNRINAYSRP